MRSLLCLDPGIRLAGAALFIDGLLIGARCIPSTATGNGAHACAEMAREVIMWARHVGSLSGTGGRSSGSPFIPTEYVCEWPQIYASRIREGKTDEDPNDMIALAGVSSAVAVLAGAPTTHYLPKEWKGQVPKKVMTKRILGFLAEQEIEIASKGILRTDPILYTDRVAALLKSPTAHNAIDAVGIGLHHLGRFDRQRVLQSLPLSASTLAAPIG